MKRSKYSSGRILMSLFDEKGTRLGTGVMESDNFIEAVDSGNALIEQGECTSFVLHRVVYNSLEHVDKHE